MNSIPVEAILLPDELSQQGDERIAWRLNSDSTVEAITVIPLGFSQSNFIDVSGPLNEGDQIVVAGMSYLKTGLAVNVRQKEGATK